MITKREVLVVETAVPGVEIQGVITESGALYLQIRDKKIDDALWVEHLSLLNSSLTKIGALRKLEAYANLVNKEAHEKLFIKYLSEKAELYIANGWAKNFNEFQEKFLQELNERG